MNSVDINLKPNFLNLQKQAEAVDRMRRLLLISAVAAGAAGTLFFKSYTGSSNTVLLLLLLLLLWLGIVDIGALAALDR